MTSQVVILISYHMRRYSKISIFVDWFVWKIWRTEKKTSRVIVLVLYNLAFDFNVFVNYVTSTVCPRSGKYKFVI